jgi:hypothetical protein
MLGPVWATILFIVLGGLIFSLCLVACESLYKYLTPNKL